MMNRKLATDELNRQSIDEFRASAKLPVVIVLDNVRSLNNIGSVFRTSDALGVERIILCGISGTPPHKEIHKTALGAEDSVVWGYFQNTIAAIEHLKAKGYSVFAVEQTTHSIDLMSFTPSPDCSIAFVFGNEVKGVAQDVIDCVDGTIEIPQFGTKHSFNISVSMGIVLWDIYVKLTKKQ